MSKQSRKAEASATPFLTVAICTYNRCESLGQAIGSLLPQANSDVDAVELLIVDNNSSDDTRETVERFGARLRYVREPRQGLGFARNRALAEARGAWVVFADDDVTFAPGWLEAWLGALRAEPDVAYAGGRLLPDWGGAPPRWHRGEKLALIDGALVWFDLGEDVRRLQSEDPTPFGANMAVRREWALEIGGFRVDLGAKGRNLARGEETEFLLRARAQGVAGLYVGAALCLHRVAPERLRLPSLFRYGLASGLAHRAIVDPHAAGGYGASLSYLLRGGFQALRGRGDRLRQCVINAGIAAALARPASPTRERA